MFVVYFLLVVTLLSTVCADNYATYPQVPKTASYNGFADPIIDVLPDCAKDCVKYSTKNTPCPYWDTGCLCVMPQWSGLVGQCIAENCTGSDVQSARFLATSLCSTVGANTWMMPASISTMLSTAAEGAKEVTTISGETAKSWVVASGSSDTNIITETSGAIESNSKPRGNNTNNSSSATSLSDYAATTSTGSTSNIAILHASGLGGAIVGLLVSFLV
ncbi:Frp1 ferric reductase [Candida orthopsilosis Co 90-125]|uniref:Frp1 ferric reductase n=1 Tax=Candida orthopsilosis (strain 90-125) TaxID=1136231 RepID=H8X7U5_CANO9|nr:Frp1 ferric reductase [Candida orthopsilosis Co 90-125]CCG23881.1 Frp1 ferric reductase [Candida orthopsilosis Co 90-125]